MFSVNHIIWMVICFSLIIGFTLYLRKMKPSLNQVLTVCCYVCIISEVIKVLGCMQMVPSSDGTQFYPYLKLQQLPFHLCSIQILLIFYVRFTSNMKARETLLAFMYPSHILGGIFAIILTTIFSNGNIEVSQAFTHPLAYQTFLYHTMLVILGLYIPYCKEVQIQFKHLYSSLAIVLGLSFISLYLNSLFASPTYVNGELISVDYTTNFFFTYRTPIGVKLNTIGEWYIYIGILLVLLFVLLTLFYLPFKKKKD